MGLFAILSITVLSAIVLSVVILNIAFFNSYAERRYAECLYAECRGNLLAPFRPINITGPTNCTNGSRVINVDDVQVETF
jgi:hypothetical protein